MNSTSHKPPDWGSIQAAGETPVLLVRHAQTAWNRERRMLGRTDIPLDEAGRAQARALADWLAPMPLTAVWSSPLLRAMQTAEALAASRALPVRPLEGLRELDQGELEGRHFNDLLQEYATFFAAFRADPASTCVPGGESLGACQSRAWEALREALRQAEPGPPVALVVHQMVLSGLLCRALDLPLRHYSLLSQRNTAVNLLAWRDGQLRVVALNLCPHLPPPASAAGSPPAAGSP